jgi:hypothetical protein
VQVLVLLIALPVALTALPKFLKGIIAGSIDNTFVAENW